MLIGDRREQARAHHGLANSYQAIGRPDRARQHWREALSLYSDLGDPKADQVREQLSGGRGSTE
jgi:Tfp pilus assembly protein PilF